MIKTRRFHEIIFTKKLQSEDNFVTHFKAGRIKLGENQKIKGGKA